MDKDSIEAREVLGSDELVLDFLNPIFGSSLFLILTPSGRDDIALLRDYPNKHLGAGELFIR